MSKYIKEKRKGFGLTQYDLSQKSGVVPSTGLTSAMVPLEEYSVYLQY